MVIRFAPLFLLLACRSALAHTEADQLGLHDLLAGWTFEPGIVVPLLLSGLLYLQGAGRCSYRRGWQGACFWSGWATLVVALLSPIHPLGEELFTAHMIQHELLMLIVAPLLVLSEPLVPLLWGLPMQGRRTVGRWSKAVPVQTAWLWLKAPAPAWCLHATALWLWHIPFLFQATLRSDWVHSAQHVSFLGSALLFWWSLFHSRTHSYGAAVLYLFTTAVHTSILGALLTFAPTLWYPAYQATAPLHGFSALEDQQVGGLIMWVPGGLVYLAAALVMFSLWLRASNGRAERSRYAT